MSLAIVTGANKGIGFGIVEKLATTLPAQQWHIYMTSRDVKRGEEALKQLHDKGLTHVRFHQLDIDSEESIIAFRDYLKKTYFTGISILVNNAGFLHWQEWNEVADSEKLPFEQVVEESMKTNFWSTWNVCKYLFPLLSKNARVVHLSSMGSNYCIKFCIPETRQKFLAVNSYEDLENLMKDFEASVRAGNHKEKNWPSTGYGMAKLGVNILTKLQAAELSKDDRNIVVNCCCPGYVATDLNQHRGVKTVEQGIETPCHLALLKENEPNGKFVSDLNVVDWEEECRSTGPPMPPPKF